MKILSMSRKPFFIKKFFWSFTPPVWVQVQKGERKIYFFLFCTLIGLRSLENLSSTKSWFLIDDLSYTKTILSKLFEVLGDENLVFSSPRNRANAFPTENEESHPKDLKKLRQYDFCIRVWCSNNIHKYVLISGS